MDRHKYNSFFDQYVLRWIDAIKVNRAGRASGGILLGYRKSLESLLSMKFVCFSNTTVIALSVNGLVFYIIPCYINCTKWSADFSVLESLMGSMTAPFVLVGDLNARVGRQQSLDVNLLHGLSNIAADRASKDSVIDEKGRKLIKVCEDSGGVILNGRTTGDVNGELTFCGAQGSSVIDYAICSFELLEFIKNFDVALKEYSDHLPLVLSFQFLLGKLSVMPSNLFPPKFKWYASSAEQYAVALNAAANTDYIFSEIPIKEKVDLFMSKIKNATTACFHKKHFSPRSAWFDSQCENQRKKMLRYLDQYRKFKLEALREQYIRCRSEYAKLCSRKRLEFRIREIDQLNHVRCSRDWWKIANSLRVKTSNVVSNISAEDFRNFFESQERHIRQIAGLNLDALQNTDLSLDAPFELQELELVLKKAKTNKAPGNDRMPYEFYKNAPQCFRIELLTLLNFIFLNKEIPASFSHSIIVPLFKKGDQSSASNYRRLSLLDCTYKLFASLLLERINAWVDRTNVLKENQAGFRKGYSTVDNIFTLTSIVHLHFSQNKKVYVYFVDFKGAFDSFPRDCMFYKLRCSGLSSHIVDVLRLIYGKTTNQVWFGNTLSTMFETIQGVRQGCVLSPILFALYLNDLEEILPGGIFLGQTNVKVLLYADDLVLLSDTPDGLQEMIDALFAYCLRWGLTVNMDKSKTLVFRKTARIPANLVWHFGNEQIQNVNQYKYLGVVLNYNLSFARH